MSHFTSSAKHYAGADDLPGFGSIDISVGATGTTLDQTAPPTLLGPDSQALSFLFWDTGRRITNKRRVRWTFSHPDRWTHWRAIAWYGATGDGPGNPEVNTGAYWIGVSPLDPTPINGAASSFVHAPGGTPVAWPWAGNDHVVRTEWGPASVVAQPHLQRSAHDPQLDFSSWIRLVAGGDGSGFFSETDNDVDASTTGSGVSGIPGDGSPVYAAAQNAGAMLLAGYVTPPGRSPNLWLDRLRAVIASDLLGKFIDKGDPSPEDIVRLKLINESIDIVRGEQPTSTDAFEALIAAGRGMTPQQLKRAIVSTQTTLRRGQAAVKSLEALAARQQAQAVKSKAVVAKKPARKGGK